MCNLNVFIRGCGRILAKDVKILLFVIYVMALALCCFYDKSVTVAGLHSQTWKGFICPFKLGKKITNSIAVFTMVEERGNFLYIQSSPFFRVNFIQLATRSIDIFRRRKNREINFPFDLVFDDKNNLIWWRTVFI